ncbi:MAG: polysaccharide biosynthesis C-terminal domain-containing protein, partial [Thermoplasmata archaeon]|nr:polysaccharide biosynthesis C-terminal domain-containing protein [Thermoplasmata archaeon]
FAFFRAHEKMGYEAFSQIIWRIVQLIILLAVMQLGYPLLEVVLALLVASVVRTIISFTMLLQMGVRPERGEISILDMMRLSKGFAAYEIIQALYANMIIIILYMYFNFDEIGWFSASLKIFLLLLLIPVSFETAIFPVLARLHHEHPDRLKKAYAKTMKFSLLVAMPATFIIYTFAEPIVGIFGGDFETSTSLLVILIFALPLRTLNMIMKTTLWSADRTNITVANILISTLVLMLATIYLIGEFGLTGAVYGFIIGEGVLLTLNYYFISKKIYKIGRYIWKPVIAGCAMSGAIYFMFMITEGSMDPISLLLLALAVYIIMIQSLKTITPYDVQTIKMALRKRNIGHR